MVCPLTSWFTITRSVSEQPQLLQIVVIYFFCIFILFIHLLLSFIYLFIFVIFELENFHKENPFIFIECKFRVRSKSRDKKSSMINLNPLAGSMHLVIF